MSKIKIRREKVKTLFMRGISKTEIAKRLKVHRATVIRDIKAIKNEIQKEIKKKELKDVLTEFILSTDATYKEAWRKYYTTNNERVQLSALRLVLDITTMKINIMQSLGIVVKQPEELKQEIIVRWKDPEDKD